MLLSKWIMIYNEKEYQTTAPCTLYSVLNECGELPDYLYGLNEKAVRDYSEKDCKFVTEFNAESILSKKHKILRFNGLDTICAVYLNGELILNADNFHRTWEVDVSDKIKKENRLEIYFYSSIKYVTEKQQRNYIFGQPEEFCIQGIAHIRKPNYSFGWDWCPQYADMGIWQNVELISYNESRLTDLNFTQKHYDGKVCLTVKTETVNNAECKITLSYPNGSVKIADTLKGTATFVIENPELWYPNGYGKQPLYTVKAQLLGNDEGEIVKKCGLRTVTVSQEEDKYGREFCFKINGKKIFAMGANYVPADMITPYITRSKLETLIKDCVNANHNMIRVWGGGLYASDDFYDLCDEYGLLVWQDLAFACHSIVLYEKFKQNLICEFRDNIKRIRSHASLALICGNNEVEQWGGRAVACDIEKAKLYEMDYLELFEHIAPDICEELVPDIFYWPSSPSSGGGFFKTNDEDVGDVHFWRVWFYDPYETYRKHYFRFLSEYGFQGFPTLETCYSFLPEEERNAFSVTMDAHQKSGVGNAKITEYLCREYRLPTTFESFVYASQVLQGEAVRTCAEHMRRNRGRCMGSLYWQLNDAWTAASWASIDYYGRWKALHYYSKRFYSPILLSLDDDGFIIKLNVSNETMCDFVGKVRYGIKDKNFNVLYEKLIDANVKSLSSKNVCEDDLCEYITNACENFLFYELIDNNGKVVSYGSHIFTVPKKFNFNSKILLKAIEIDGKKFISLKANSYARRVEITVKDCDIKFSDNFFDIISNEELLIEIDSNATILKINSNLSYKTLEDIK